MKNEFFDTVKKGVKYWWVGLLVGLLAVVLGIWCLFTPDATLVAMTWVFIVIFLLSGVSEIVFSVSNRHMRGWGWSLAGGIIEILFGILLVVMPKVFIAAILVYLVGFWMLFRGIWGIGEAAELNTIGVRGWGWSLAGAILTILFAFFFLLSPALFKGIFVVALISVSLLTYGAYRIFLAFRLRSIHKDIKEIEGN